MDVYSNLQTLSLRARQNRHPSAALLTTLIADTLAAAKRERREPTDDDCVKAVNAHIAGINSTLEQAANLSEEQTKALTDERALLASLVPKTLTATELNTVMRKVADELKVSWPPQGKEIGMVLRGCQQRYPNRVDGKLAQQIIRGD